MDTTKVFGRHEGTRQLLFAVAVLVCLTPWVTPPVALVLGLVVALFIGHPFLHLNHKATHILLQVINRDRVNISSGYHCPGFCGRD